MKLAEGFTLLEVLVATAIVSIGLLGMGALTARSMQNAALSRDITTATVVAQEKLEDLRRQGFCRLPEADTSAMEDYGDMARYPSYKRITAVTMAGPGGEEKEIMVTVYWDLDRHSLSLSTLVGR